MRSPLTVFIVLHKEVIYGAGSFPLSPNFPVPTGAEQPLAWILWLSVALSLSLAAHWPNCLAQGNVTGHLHVGRWEGLEETGLCSADLSAGAWDINKGKETSYDWMLAAWSFVNETLAAEPSEPAEPNNWQIQV